MIIATENGTPKSLRERNETEQSVCHCPESIGTVFTVHDHPAMFSMDKYQLPEKEIDRRIPKDLFLCNRQQTMFYLLCMPGDKPFRTKELSSQINSARLSFAMEVLPEDNLHCYSGSASIFGLIHDTENRVGLSVDECLLEEPFLGFHPCQNTSTVKVPTDAILSVYLKAVHHEVTSVKLIGE